MNDSTTIEVDAGGRKAGSSPSISLTDAVVALSRREILRSLATPAVTVQSVAFPGVLLLVLLAVFGTAVEEFTGGQPYVQRVTPALVVSGAAFGSLGTVLGLFEDRSSGFFDRIRLTPFAGTTPDPSGLRGLRAMMAARSISEHVRVLAVTVVLTALGATLGFRFEAGIGRTVAFFVLATVFGASFCWIGFALATKGSSMESVVPPVSGLFLILLFLSHGMVPLEAFPDWIQPVVEVAPSSLMMLTLQRLSGGGEVLGPLLGALAWTVGFTVIFGGIAANSIADLAKSSGGEA